MSVVIASSPGAPIREQETLIADISTKARTAILSLRISSSVLAASERSGGLGATRGGISAVCTMVQKAFILHVCARRTHRSLLEFCSIWLGNAILPGRHPSLVSLALASMYNRFGCAKSKTGKLT